MKIQTLSVLCALSLVACEEEAPDPVVTETPEPVVEPEPEPEPMPTQAKADMAPTEGNQVRGTVELMAQDEGVKVTVQFSGLEPGSEHGFHIHETGDCSAADGSSAGGHWNPGGHDHALPEGDGPRHAGDMGNVTADDEGNVELELAFSTFSLDEEPNAIGKAFILHADPDDGSQPTGNAGARIACGVIERVEAEAGAHGAMGHGGNNGNGTGGATEASAAGDGTEAMGAGADSVMKALPYRPIVEPGPGRPGPIEEDEE